MTTQNQLLTNAVTSANNLISNINQYTDKLDAKVAAKVAEVDAAHENFTSVVDRLTTNISSSNAVGPNFIADSAFYDLLCGGKKNTWVDYTKIEERGNFSRIFGNSTANIDLDKSKIRIKVIPGIPPSNTPDPETGISVNGDLLNLFPDNTMNEYSGFSKHILVLDVEIYALTSEATYFYFDNPGCDFQVPVFETNAKKINSGLTFSGFYNVVKNDNILPPNGNSAQVNLMLNGGSPTSAFTLSDLAANLYVTKNNISSIIPVENNTLKWHFNTNTNLGGIGGCPFTNAILLIGSHWVTTPFKLTIAFALPYLGFGDFGNNPVWTSEATNVTSENKTNRYPFGIRYTI